MNTGDIIGFLIIIGLGYYIYTNSQVNSSLPKKAGQVVGTVAKSAVYVAQVDPANIYDSLVNTGKAFVQNDNSNPFVKIWNWMNGN